jgi:hypothetical protein
MDIRLKQLSYSSMTTLHSCPRRFQLYKLNSKESDAEEDLPSSITFAFGHLVGTGIQLIMEGKPWSEVLFNSFVNWKLDLFSSDDKRAKSFFKGIAALEKYNALRAAGFLKDYELVYYEGKPATELSFSITFPDGFVYRGFVDAVLRNTKTGEILVLEVKTTSFKNLSPALYKNSAQAIGYSIVLDVLFPTLSSYDVQYLPYKTTEYTYEPMKFTKSYLQRALWIRELLLDIESIKMYEEAGVYPMHGESCYSFFRECEYFNLCTLGTDKLTVPLTEKHAEKIQKENEEKYQIKLTLDDLINAQLQKA